MKSLPEGVLLPENPQVIRLSSSNTPKNFKTHQYIIATAFDRKENPSVQNAKTAARAIVELAEENQLESVAIVPLGSGAGGLPASEVYQEMVAGVTERLPVDNIKEISFITINAKYLQELQSLFLKRTQSLKNDLARGEDLLGVASEISSLAEVLLMRDLEPPLTVGILGGWGSGKTFAMHLMKEEMARIRTLAVPADKAWPDTADPDAFPYVGHVYMINFDAWTYAKSDLWASLMQTILCGLNQQLIQERKIAKALGGTNHLLDSGNVWRYIYDLPKQKKSIILNSELGEEAVKRFLKEQVSTSVTGNEHRLWDNLRTVREDERKKLREAKQELEKRKAELKTAHLMLENKLREKAASEARSEILNKCVEILSSDVMEKIESYSDLGIEVDPSDFDQFLTLTPTFRDVRTVIAKDGWWYLVFVLFLLCSVIVSSKFSIEIIGLLGPAISVVLMISRFVPRWKKLLLYGFNVYQEQVSIEREKLYSNPSESLRKKQHEVEEAKKAVAESQEKVALHRERLGPTAEYQTLHEFIEKRLHDGTYETGLGPMHRIQEDFAKITSDFTVLEDDPQKSRKKEIFPRGPARIVLFIDDLDRCPPDKVVEMLEAVQILIKTSLFVVVMAIDVRFITRALENEYHGILTRRGDPSGLDYIEKIIQIPYRVRTIAPSAVRTYLRSQMEIEERETESPEQPSFGETESEPQGTAEEPSAQPPEDEVENRLPRDVIKFTRQEFEMIEAICSEIGLTPRAVKRLVNVYKILKIVWFRPNRYAEPDFEVKQVTIALLALAARYPDFMRDALWQLDNWVNQAQRNRRLQDCLPHEEDQCSAYTKRECSQLITAASDLIPPEIRVDALSGGILDLIRSFSFVGDIGYSPDEDEQRYAHQMSPKEAAN